MSSNCVLKSNHGSFGGEVLFYSHASIFTKTTMNFSIFLPPKDNGEKVPALIYLAGLTCTDETFMIKSGAQKYASKHRIAIICPDTSPREAGIDGEDVDLSLIHI